MPLPMSGPDNPSWRIVPGFDLHWKHLEDRYLVYNSGSGHTHVLDPIAALLMQQLAERPARSAELVQRMSTLLNYEAMGEFHETLEQTLRQLADLGLIESVSA
jgi:PqqD family protein of HPr-rel-A system